MSDQTNPAWLSRFQTVKTSQFGILILATTQRLADNGFSPYFEHDDNILIHHDQAYIGFLDKPLLDYIRNNTAPSSNEITQQFRSGSNRISVKWKLIPEAEEISVEAETICDRQRPNADDAHSKCAFRLNPADQFQMKEDAPIAIKSMQDLNHFIDTEILNRLFSGNNHPDAPGRSTNPQETSHAASEPPSTHQFDSRPSPNYPDNPGMLVGPNHPLFRRYIPMGSRFDPVFPDNPLGVYPPPGILPQQNIPDDLGGQIPRGPFSPGALGGFRGRGNFGPGGGFRGGFY